MEKGTHYEDRRVLKEKLKEKYPVLTDTDFVMKLQTCNDEESIVTIKRVHVDTLLCAAEWYWTGENATRFPFPQQANDRLEKIIESYRAERSQLS